MHRGMKITFIVIGSLIALVLLLLITLLIAGSQEVTDPFTSGIDVVSVPYESPATVAWRLVGVEGTTALYVSTSSHQVAATTDPAMAGYEQLIEPRIETIDGVQVYAADIESQEDVYVRVYADIDGIKWSEEFLVEASS
jgi:hypothetical protein